MGTPQPNGHWMGRDMSLVFPVFDALFLPGARAGRWNKPSIDCCLNPLMALEQIAVLLGEQLGKQ